MQSTHALDELPELGFVEFGPAGSPEKPAASSSLFALPVSPKERAIRGFAPFFCRKAAAAFRAISGDFSEAFTET